MYFLYVVVRSVIIFWCSSIRSFVIYTLVTLLCSLKIPIRSKMTGNTLNTYLAIYKLVFRVTVRLFLASEDVPQHASRKRAVLNFFRLIRNKL